MEPSTDLSLRATVYGPAVAATARVDDPAAVAALAALPRPAIPRPVLTAPPAPPAPRPRLAIAGLILSVMAPPIGLVVSAAALTRILERRPRPPGEALAVLGVAVSVIALAALWAVAIG